MRHYIDLFFLFTSSTLVSQISSFTSSDCLTELESFYYYEETLTAEELKDFSLNDQTQIRLKDGLTSQIISFIQTKSTLSLAYSQKNQDDFFESEVFSSFSQSDSNAIIFNPRYSLCKIQNESGDIYKVYVYVEKESFDRLAISYFKSLTERLTYSLDINKSFYNSNPNYEFVNEINNLETGIKMLDSYFGLMISLSVDQELINLYFKLSSDIESFSNDINSLDNNLIRVNSYLDNTNYEEAYNLLINLDTKYPSDPLVEFNKDRYNRRVQLARQEKLDEYKNNASSYNNFSLELGLNSALLNSYSGNSGSVSYNSNENSYTDRLYTYLESRYTFNNRGLNYGIGPYVKFHFSKLLFVLNEKEYYFPFSDSFTEIGIWGQYFIKNSEGDNISSISFGAGKLLESFKTESGQNISFNAFSPGFNFYLKDKSRKSHRRSISVRFNIIHGVKQYSYSSFSVGYSFNFKNGRKISEDQEIQLNKDFKLLK